MKEAEISENNARKFTSQLRMTSITEGNVFFFFVQHYHSLSFSYYQVLHGIMLRRTKDEERNGKPMIVLPPKHVDVILLDFSKEVREKRKRKKGGGE